MKITANNTISDADMKDMKLAEAFEAIRKALRSLGCSDVTCHPNLAGPCEKCAALALADEVDK